MKKNKVPRTRKKTAYKIPLITEKDAKEYEAIKASLIAELKILGSYKPGIDDIHIAAIAGATIHIKNSEKLLDSEKANEETYSRITDAQAKERKIIESALHALAVTRRERIAAQTGKAGEEELVKQILEAIKNRPK